MEAEGEVMKKFFKKSLIYLIMTMLVMPTWLVVGISKADHAQAADPVSIDVYSITNEVISPNNDGVKDSSAIDLKFSAPVKVDLDILNSSGSVVKNLYKPESTVTNPEPKIWDGTNDLSEVVGDGIYTISISYTYKSADEVPVDVTKVDKTKTIIVDTQAPKLSLLANNSTRLVGQLNEPIFTSLDGGVTFVPATSGSLDGAFVVSSDVVYTANYDQLLNEITVDFSGGVKKGSTIILSNEPFVQVYDAAGNKYVKEVATFNGTKWVWGTDIVAPTVKIESPLEMASVNGTEKIVLSADEEINSNCSVVLSLDKSDWSLCVSGDTTLNDVPGFRELADGPFTLYAAVTDLAGNPATSDSKVSVKLIKDTIAKGSVEYSTTNPTNGSVVATLVSDEDLTITNNGGLDSYTFTENGSFTFEFEDLAGNTGSAIATVSNIDKTVIVSPQITTTVSGKTISISWTKVDGAVSYIVYSNPESNGIISSTNKGVDPKKVGDVSSYTLNVSEYGKYYVTVTAVDSFGNESPFLSEFTGQKLISVLAPVTVEPSVETVPVTVAPSKAQAAVGSTNTTTPVAVATDNNGQIKGDDNSATPDASKINWTPWIVLFVLIILSGAATGGYFYWFSGEEEVAAVVRAPKKVVSTEKSVKDAPVKKSSSSSNKKSKRW